MPALEVSHKLKGEEKDGEKEKGTDKAVETGRMRRGARGGSDPAGGGEDEAEEEAREGGEGGKRAVELEKKEKGDLPGAPAAEAGGGGRGARIAGSGEAGGRRRAEAEGLALAVPELLELVVLRRRRRRRNHGDKLFLSLKLFISLKIFSLSSEISL